MATSDSFNTNAVGNFYCTISWARTGYSSELNEHYIYYEVIAHNTSGNYRRLYDRKLIINGTAYLDIYTTTGTPYYDGDVITSGTLTTPSSDSAGNGSIAISFQAGVGSYHGYNSSGDGSWDLDRIPRYANFTEHYVSSTDLNSITIHWNADAGCDWVQYSLNDGAWQDTSGLTYTISGLSPNTQYSIRTRIRRTDSQLWTETSYVYGTTKDIVKVTQANNFNSDSNPYVEISNLNGFTYNLRLEFGGTIISRNGITTHGGYTFSLTQAERDLLYSKCPNANTLTVRYVVATLLNGNETWWSYLDRTMTVVGSNPTFSNFNYADTGTVSTQLTGNNQIVINNYNVMEINIPAANKAVATNGASMSKYRAVCGNLATEANYSSNSDVTLSLKYIKDRTITVYAIDSRGNSTPVQKSISIWKDYFDPVIRIGTVTRQNGVDTETVLNFSATFWKPTDGLDFGAVANEITECSYKYKKTNESSYGNAINITPTVSSGNISFNATIAGDEGANGFNVSSSFNIQITLKDKIRTVTYDLLLGAGSPAIAVHRNGVSFGAPYNTSVGGACQIQGKRSAAFELTSFITTPLTKDNTILTDTNISKARLVIVYYTFQYTGFKYRGSVVIPTNDTAWYVVNHFDNSAGYIRIDKENNELIVSTYSANDFAVLGYTLIM